MIRFILNDKEISTGLPGGTTLLDFIRYEQHLKGTKIGCREGDCGACTVLIGSPEDQKVEYQSVTSCLMPIGNAAGKHIVTIEGINQETLTPVQKAFAGHNASQCGFCTPGFIMSLTACCMNKPHASPAEAIASMDGNICRCTGYASIIHAAHDVSALLQENQNQDQLEYAVANKMVPAYFLEIPSRLQALQQEPIPAEDYEFIVGGGTDLYVQKHDLVSEASLHYSIQENQNYLREKGERIEIGAATDVSSFYQSALIQKYFSNVDAFVKLISSTPIRNMATLAGNFINASPIGDFTIFFLTLKTQLHFYEPRSGSNRIVDLKDFYKSYKTVDKLPGEKLTHFVFDKPSPKGFFNFEKVSKRTHLDIASVNTAIYLQQEGECIRDARISAGGVGPIPMLLTKTNAFLAGKMMREEMISEAIQIMRSEISPIPDARGSGDYKRFLLERLIRVHFKLAALKNKQHVK